MLDPELFPHAPVDCIPKTTVRIDVTGQGWVYPGVGDHQFATYAQTCAFTCPVTEPPECGYNTVSLTADPAAGWAFRRWWGVDEDVAREPELAVTCDAPQFISAEFVERPGLDTLDLLRLIQFLSSFPSCTWENELRFFSRSPTEKLRWAKRVGDYGVD